MKIPASTYRVQIRPGFTLRDAEAILPYLRSLGVGWLYLSPLLEATDSSEHGYDVCDPSRVDPARGGGEALASLSAAAHAEGMGLLVDIVPNHVGVAVPAQNPWWWSLLREGRGSRYAEAFDVDWDAAGGKVLLPILGSEDDLTVLRLEDGELRYYGHRFPLAPGTWKQGETAPEVHARQHYELIPWRLADTRLNYRRFFAINSLAGVRVEVPWVFDEAHTEVKRWFDEGLVDGLRIDHPDGLADPAGYLSRLREVTGGAYTLVEKILEGHEELPASFQCEGTTGYDALGLVDRLFVDPAGEAGLTALDAELRGGEPADFADMVHGTKRWMTDGLLRAEILRLARLALDPVAEAVQADPAAAELVEAESLPRHPEVSAADPDAVSPLETAADALAEVAAQFPVYRTYLPAGREVLARACRDAAARRPDLAATIGDLEPRLADPAGELGVRFQQTTGMVMAKAVEDTAFYRYTRLGTLTEVGGDPTHFSVSPDEFHARMAERERHQPHTMTTLTTHDTKRSEDARARISVLSELAEEWAALVPRLNAFAPLPDGPLSNLLWQAILGAWPAEAGRLTEYALKAAREAGVHTLWTAPDEEFETAVRALVDIALVPGEVRRLLEELSGRIDGHAASNALSAKLVQLAMPGVPDVYQGTEFWDRSLCDPDNRRDVDFAARAAALEALDAGAPVRGPLVQEAKLLVVSRTLRLRRDRPGLFSGYASVEAHGPAAEHLVGFRRGERGALALATRLPAGLERRGGWGETSVRLSRPMRDAFTQTEYDAGEHHVGEVFAALPVALLIPEEGA
ncbi:alpha-amylase family glycosyl hydrolase [Sinomonas mesophila]|uniref:alpha-amylase family glycosyl hydrolase n=1 Tax=Sinomonas mesophila TaxID=1531955 RepID=UPI000985C161|nr:alpha-amylase family glycosyl hydrolase [Sinomonas mesophila]